MIKIINSDYSKVLVCLGTSQELVRFAPVIKALEKRGVSLSTVCLGQHDGSMKPLFELFGIRAQHQLETMRYGRAADVLGSRLLDRLDAVLAAEKPDLVLVQGDNESAVLGSLAAFNRGIPVGHLEAGQQAGNPQGQESEGMYRRLVGQIVGCHFASTEGSRRMLMDEGSAADAIHVVGHTAVDALHQTLASKRPGITVELMQQWVAGRRLVLVSEFSSESTGDEIAATLRVLREFIELQPDLCMIFPLHPNPEIRTVVMAELDCHPRIRLMDPLGYSDTIHLLSGAWLVVSDSGDFQEEAAALGVPMIVLDENAACPEAVECGVVRLAGTAPEQLSAILHTALADEAWHLSAGDARDVFGDGHAAARICDLLLGARNSRFASQALRMAA